MDIEDKSNSEELTSSEYENEKVEKVKYDIIEKLKKTFKNLYNKLHDIHNELVLMLDELETINCLTEEQCNAINEHLKKKIGVQNDSVSD